MELRIKVINGAKVVLVLLQIKFWLFKLLPLDSPVLQAMLVKRDRLIKDTNLA